MSQGLEAISAPEYVGVMRQSDIIGGAKSGIQKAIRRGDLHLAKTCFDILWEDIGTQRWLLWRIPVLAAEECPNCAGEAAKFLMNDEIREDGRQALRLLYRMCLAIKNKDVSGILGFARSRNEQWASDLEVMDMRAILDIEETDPSFVAADTYQQYAQTITDEYTLQALAMMRKRAHQGGLLGDKWLCIAAMVILGNRPLSRDTLLSVEKARIKALNRHHTTFFPVKTINLPWYVFDIHTGAGKRAKQLFFERALNRKYGIRTESEYDLATFYLVSAFVPENLKESIEGGQPTIEQTHLWESFVLSKLAVFGHRVSLLSSKFASFRDEIASCVLEVID